MGARKLQLKHVPDALAERIAWIIGPQSAHARALEECRARRAAGEIVHLWSTGDMILVGPDPSPPSATTGDAGVTGGSA